MATLIVASNIFISTYSLQQEFCPLLLHAFIMNFSYSCLNFSPNYHLFGAGETILSPQVLLSSAYTSTHFLPHPTAATVRAYIQLSILPCTNTVLNHNKFLATKAVFPSH